MKLQIDFYADWVEIVTERLKQMGYSVDPNADHHSITMLYFNAIRRRISPRARIVIRSKEFSCPADLQGGLTDFERKITHGEDINPHLSRGLKKVTYNDDLLNDWGIYHFHLGQKHDADGFIERTGPVLFAHVGETEFHEINVYQHGNWSNLDVVEIVHANWPSVIDRFRLKGIQSLAIVPDTGIVKTLRDVHINAILQLKDGTIYAPPGGGYMTDGTSMEVVMAADRHARTIKAWEDWILNNTDKLNDGLKGTGIDETKPLKVRLEIDDKAVYAACPEYGVRFVLKKNT